MIKTRKPLATICTMLKKEGVRVQKKEGRILLDCISAKININKIKSVIYYLLNNFEQKNFIALQNIAYCLLPDASHHVAYKKNSRLKYYKKFSCKSCKYDLLCSGISENRYNTLKVFPAPIPDLPEEVVLELTQKCNLKCPLCFSQKKSKDLAWSKVKQTIDQCIKLGIKDIRFTGGEPLLYPDLGKVLRYAKSKGAYVTVNTNATLLNQTNKKIIKQYVDNVLISLQGFDTNSENKLTQSIVDFKQKLKNIIYLQQTISFPRLGTIISQTFYRNFSKYFKIIKKLGIKHWELYRPMSNLEIDEFKISNAQFIKLLRKIRSCRVKTGINIRAINPVPFCFTNNFSLSEQVLFGAYKDDGHSRLILNQKGFRPSYPIAKYLGHDLKKAWQSKFLKNIRNLSYLSPKCKNCFYLNICRGGSRYWAQKNSGSYFDCDPLTINNKK